MSEQTREEALAHFGKKGMRWGVRNTPTTGSSSGKSSAPASTGSKSGGKTQGKTPKTPAQQAKKARRMATLTKAATVTMFAGAVAARSIVRHIAVEHHQEAFDKKYLRDDMSPDKVNSIGPVIDQFFYSS